MSARAYRRIELCTYAFWLALACMVALTISCASKGGYERARPKYGDSTTPVGPPKDAYRSQPKFR